MIGRVTYGAIGVLLGTAVYLVLNLVYGYFQAGASIPWLISVWNTSHFVDLWVCMGLVLVLRLRSGLALALGVVVFGAEFWYFGITPRLQVGDLDWSVFWYGLKPTAFAVITGLALATTSYFGRRCNWRITSIGDLRTCFEPGGRDT